MRCWGSSKGLAVALCWSPGLKRSTRQRRDWTGTGENAKQGSRTYLGMVCKTDSVLSANPGGVCRQFVAVREDGSGGLVTGQGQMSRSRADTHSHLTWTTGCHVQIAAPHLQRRAVGGGAFHLGLSPARPGIQRPTSNTKPPRTNWKEPGSFPKKGLKQNTRLPI